MGCYHSIASDVASDIVLKIDPLDIINGKIPDYNQLQEKSQSYCLKILNKFKNIDRSVAVLIALYFDKYAPLPSVFSCSNLEIYFFKEVSDPNHPRFNPIFQNVLEANPTLQEKIATIVIGAEDDDDSLQSS